MGKTKIKTIDDSVPAEVEKVSAKGGSASGRKKADLLVESLKAELGIENQSSVISKPVKTDQLKTGKQTADNRKQQTGNQARTRSKRYQEKAALVDKSQTYKLDEAVVLAQNSAYTKFPGSLEIHINTSQKNLRGLVSLPYSTGKELRILAFGPTSLREELGGMGVLIGTEETISEILKGNINFDLVVATPEWMPKVAQTAKILGPKGLMPNPKNGTVTTDLPKIVTELKSGKTEYKTENQGQIIHMLTGKAGQDPSQISANVKAIYNTLGRSKIKKITLSPTMGPGVKVDLTSI